MPYQPRELLGVKLPGAAGEEADRHVIIGAFDLRAHGEIELWRRLMETSPELSGYRVLMIGVSDRESGEEVFPPSLHSRIDWLSDEDGAWRRLIDPDRPERAFAVVVEDGIAQILVIGPPTEEALDRCVGW